MSSQNLSLGGGGTAYITGYEANFMNPANLMIPDRTTSFTIGVGQLGAFSLPVTPSGNTSGQIGDYLNYMDAYQPDSQQLSLEDRDALVERNYKGKRQVSEHQHRFDAILGGLHWRRENYSISLTARTRTATRIEVGRGWYDPEYYESNGTTGLTRNMNLTQQSQVLYEFSLGYAQTFDFVTGLLPRLGKLYIGIAPKFIISGSHLNLQYDARYHSNDQSNQSQLVSKFQYGSTANYTRATKLYAQTRNARNSIALNFPAEFRPNYQAYTEPTGYGGGFDFGLVYVLSLGDDLSLARTGTKEPLKKSLRLGFSVTDLGFVTYTKNPLSVTLPRDTLAQQNTGPVESRFDGTPGQYVSFLDNQDDALNPLNNILVDTGPQSSFTAILPTSFNAGMLLQIDRIKLAADLTLGLNDTAFNNTKLIGHFGMELNPFEPIPLRFGVQLAAGYPTLWTAGTGIQMDHWELSLATQFSARSSTSLFELNGAAMGGLKFHF